MYDIYTYIYHKFRPNVGKYTSPMDAMGYGLNFQFPIPLVLGGVGGASEAIGISTSLILLHGSRRCLVMRKRAGWLLEHSEVDMATYQQG